MAKATEILVPPPGTFIKEEIEARNWIQRDLAFVLGVPEQSVNMIIGGKRGISPEMAKALGDAFDVAPEFFLNLQAEHDLSNAEQPDPGIVVRSKLQNFYPLREMIKRGWLPPNSDHNMLGVQIARFFGVASSEDIPHLSHAAKKTYYDETPPAQLAWLFRVKQIASNLIVPDYSEKKLLHAIDRLGQLLLAPEEVRKVPAILAECGIRFVVVEGLPGAKIDGVCFWLDKKSPVIGITTLRDKIDNFWFVLRHEIEHVLRKHGQDTVCIDENVGILEENASNFDEEKMANAAAANFCVPQKELKNFIDRTNPFFSEHKVLGFANRLNIHPGLVVGQIQRCLDNYGFLTKHQAKIRQFLISSSATDGFGQIYPVDL